ncbi:MAG: hypothetical protein IT168_08330 [Bryobacterales bacterium]|nr:hypothetical protein [Bryobacterales bacterium]
MIRPTALCLLALAVVAPAMLAVDASMLHLVMGDAKVITGADFDNLRNSPFGQHMLATMNLEGKEFQSFIAMTGFDPRLDLREVVVASSSVDGQKAVAIIRGTFDEGKIVALAVEHGGTVEAYGSAKLITGPSKAGHAGPVIGLMGGLMLAGQEEAVMAAVDRAQNGKPLAADVAARVQSASTSYHAWVVTTASPAELAGRFQNPNVSGAMKGDLMQAIENVSAGVRFGANVEMGGEATTRSDKDATALTDVVRFLVQMASSNAPNAGLGSLAQSLQLNAQGRVVKFMASIPESDFEKLFGTGRGPLRMRARPAVAK